MCVLFGEINKFREFIELTEDSILHGNFTINIIQL